MTATVRDDRLSRSVMFLCLGAALLLLGIQWRAWAAKPDLGNLSTQAAGKGKATSGNGSGSYTATANSQAAAKKSSKLLLDLSDRRVYVYRDQQRLHDYPVAIGQAGWETPSGSFQVLEMRRDPTWQHPITGEVIPAGTGNPLGKRWIGFLYEGRTHIGFHGTNQEELIGQAVSHGCVRMRNQDVVALYEQVEPGTPVDVRP